MPPAPKPLLNEMEVDGVVYRVAISLCPGEHFGQDLVASEALFACNQISFEDFSKDPLKILNNKSLVCLINDRYFTWAVAGAYLTSLMLFRKPLSDETLHQLSLKDSRQLSDLSEDRAQAADPPTRFGVLSRWLRGSQTSNQLHTEGGDQRQRSPSAGSEIIASVEEAYSKHSEEPISGDSMLHEREPMTRSLSMPVGTGRAGSISSEGTWNGHIQDLIPHSKRYAKTLRLTSDQLKSLDLKKGSNTLTFSVTSSYQGKAVCTAKLFLWEHDYQVVISDIDGTITKSDALGHIFTMAGKDWTHSGVAKLYTDITNNGYHILYLTSRAIGQADYTRKYLKNVEQDNYQLPDGPVIMSPDRLFTAFHREVIMRKPEEFKMACLRDIKRLFADRNPFYAGFGNRITDALSYRSVDVPPSKIFTISPDGNVTLELLRTYQSSYIALNDLVNEIFPGTRHATEYNDWNYWKPTLPSIELPLAPSPQPTTDTAPHAVIVHPLDIPTVQRQPSGFSVSPPQLASRLSETVIPYLRGNRSKSPETQQGAIFSEDHSQGNPANLPTFSEKHQEDFYEELTYEVQGQYETFLDDEYVEEDEEEYEEYQGEEEIVFEEGSVDEEDDVELNLDAPFL
ncbi:hypothetical protein BGZ82_006384 [Podila clonocystis]|nr:hypothetical protein BGZ82_006384 [Podila clonocystis]